MEKLGGGGHQTMAATQLKNTTVEQAQEQLYDAVTEYIKTDLLRSNKKED